MDGRIKKILKKPSLLFFTLGHRGILNFMPDEKYLKKAYKIKLGAKLNLEDPKTFNEKLQWLKLYDRKPIYTTMVDKYEAKKYVADIIGEEHIIPTLGVWNRFEDIDFDALPDQFVLKCTHDSGGLVICRDKSTLNFKKAKKRIKQSLRHNFFGGSREWPYKNVQPRIIAEKFMSDDVHESLIVYKIFNFGGEPKIIQVIQDDKTPKESIDYFDTDWNLLDLRQNYPNSETHLPKPANLDLMLEFSWKLSKDAPPFIRTDFYEINGKIYFSEFTFFSDSGLAKFNPPDWDSKLGSWIHLPVKTEENNTKA